MQLNVAKEKLEKLAGVLLVSSPTYTMVMMVLLKLPGLELLVEGLSRSGGF